MWERINCLSISVKKYFLYKNHDLKLISHTIFAPYITKDVFLKFSFIFQILYYASTLRCEPLNGIMGKTPFQNYYWYYWSLLHTDTVHLDRLKRQDKYVFSNFSI